MSIEDDDLSALIRRHATRHAAPDGLRASIRTQVALEDARQSSPLAPARAAGARPRRGWFTFGWGTASASFALGMLCMALLIPLAQRVGEPVDADLVTDHVRALRSGEIASVLSSDRHTVKPWFQGRLDFAPPVLDLAGDGFPLIGGRVEHVRGQTVATLAYSHNRHVLDLFVWPSGEQQQPVRQVRRGFNVVHWADGSMQYWAVSDMDRAEVEAFTRAWQQRAAAQ
ncbi:MAG TPA: anti-sigma factor [Burkholderiaceae bacterium]|nr:anti-sigma factor [Burkholderiaceae bacterium]